MKFLPVLWYQTVALCAVTHGVQSEGDGDFKQVICSAEHEHISLPASACYLNCNKVKEYTKISSCCNPYNRENEDHGTRCINLKKKKKENVSCNLSF